jgi:transmembrane sensor
MTTNQPDSAPPDDGRSRSEEAAYWMARRDGGFTAAEQDAFFEWLRQDPRNAEAFSQLERSWVALDGLALWQTVNSASPNPDLLAPKPAWRLRARWGAALGLGLAAVVSLGFFLARSLGPAGAPIESQEARIRVLPAPVREVLADGSSIQLKEGARIQAAFTAELRRLHLLAGECYISVAKDPARPFVMELGSVAVRAVGTAFNVNRRAGAVEVLVLEGLVHVEPVAAVAAVAPVPVGANQRARVPPDFPRTQPVVAMATPQDFDRALSWQGLRLEFHAVPLERVVQEFNRRNAQKLAIGDDSIGQMRVSGAFRVDQVAAFVRMIKASLGLTVEHRPDSVWVLRRAE